MSTDAKIAWGALAALTVLRLILAADLPLAPDEAYYWLWSQHLQAGYFDHPPMVAFWIRAGTALVGNTTLGIRLAGPISAAIGSLALWSAAESLFPGRQAGLLAAALLNATVMVGVGAIVMTPDTPLFFAWTCGLAAAARLIATQNPRWWLAIGAAGGCALLSKYTGLLFVAGIGAWVITSAPGRASLRTIWPWAGLLLAALMFTPNIFWNATHEWASYIKQGSRVTNFDADRAAQYLAELVVGQIGLASPVIFGLAAWGTWRLRLQTQAGLLLFWLSVLPMAIFVEHIISGRVQSNWPAIIYPAVCIAAAGLPVGILKTWTKPALAVGFGLTLLVYAQALAAPVPIPARADPTALQLAGWAGVATQIAGATPSFVTSDEYGPAAELAFLLPPNINVAAFGGSFDRRWDFLGLPQATALAGTTGIMVTRRQDTPCADLLGTVTRQRGGQIIATYKLCRFAALRDGVILPRP
jgi:4-amino-4-deoxy-L-arabinose transferase-like glycosyltransferase